MGSAEQLSSARSGAAARTIRPGAAWGLVLIAGLCRAVLLTAVALTSWTVLPGALGFETTTVMSGSMMPRFEVGDAVVTRPIERADLTAGQVVLFDDPDAPGDLRLHRLVRARGDVLTTKGDANTTEDSSTIGYGAVHGAGFLRVPFAGLPAYWFRTQQHEPLLIGVGLVVVLLVGSRLDRRFTGGRHTRSDAPRRRGRHSVRVGGAVIPVVLVLALGAHTVVAAPESAQARFSNSTDNAPNSLAGCWDWPVRGTLPTPALAYLNYMEPSGSTTVDRSRVGVSGTLAGTVGRVGGTCELNASPYIHVGDGGASGVSVPTTGLPADVTVATWFRTSVRSGTLANAGSSASGSSGTIDRALYITSSGAVAFTAITLNLLGSPLGSASCQSPAGVANNQWHLVVATFSTTSGCTISIDGAAPIVGSAAVNTSAVNIQVLTGVTGYWRFGYDNVGFGWSNAGPTPYFQGDLDESQVYGTVLTSTQQAAILTRGH